MIQRYRVFILFIFVIFSEHPLHSARIIPRQLTALETLTYDFTRRFPLSRLSTAGRHHQQILRKIKEVGTFTPRSQTRQHFEKIHHEILQFFQKHAEDPSSSRSHVFEETQSLVSVDGLRHQYDLIYQLQSQRWTEWRVWKDSVNALEQKDLRQNQQDLTFLKDNLPRIYKELLEHLPQEEISRKIVWKQWLRLEPTEEAKQLEGHLKELAKIIDVNTNSWTVFRFPHTAEDLNQMIYQQDEFIHFLERQSIPSVHLNELVEVFVRWNRVALNRVIELQQDPLLMDRLLDHPHVRRFLDRSVKPRQKLASTGSVFSSQKLSKPVTSSAAPSVSSAIETAAGLATATQVAVTRRQHMLQENQRLMANLANRHVKGAPSPVFAELERISEHLVTLHKAFTSIGSQVLKMPENLSLRARHIQLMEEVNAVHAISRSLTTLARAEVAGAVEVPRELWKQGQALQKQHHTSDVIHGLLAQELPPKAYLGSMALQGSAKKWVPSSHSFVATTTTHEPSVAYSADGQKIKDLLDAVSQRVQKKTFNLELDVPIPPLKRSKGILTEPTSSKQWFTLKPLTPLSDGLGIVLFQRKNQWHVIDFKNSVEWTSLHTIPLTTSPSAIGHNVKSFPLQTTFSFAQQSDGTLRLSDEMQAAEKAYWQAGLVSAIPIGASRMKVQSLYARQRVLNALLSLCPPTYRLLSQNCHTGSHYVVDTGLNQSLSVSPGTRWFGWKHSLQLPEGVDEAKMKKWMSDSYSLDDEALQRKIGVDLGMTSPLLF